MGLTASVSTDTLSSVFQKAKNSIDETISNISKLQSILSESTSGTGISEESLTNFRDMFGDDCRKGH